MAPRQQHEASLIKRLAKQFGWEVESILSLPNSIAVEYKLRKISDGKYWNLRGRDVLSPSERFLEDYFTAQFRNAD
jgi:hypothetical protein